MNVRVAGMTARVLLVLCGLSVVTAPGVPAQDRPAGGDMKILASFEEGSPFTTGELIREFPSDRVWPIIRGEVVAEHATAGARAVRASDGALILQGPMDWSGYDFLKVDVFNSDSAPQQFGIEAQDANTASYWQQILYTTVLQSGANTVVLPLEGIRHGGKGRPGSPVDLAHIRLLALKAYSPSDKPAYIDNLRLTRDVETPKLLFEGLHAFDLGTETSPVMKGFRRLDPTMPYDKERGYGLRNAQLYGGRAFDGFQPDPLYRDWLSFEKGGIAVDLPNGRYRVFMNIDSPSGYWGEYPFYRNRKVLAQGKVVVDESMDFAALKKKYFRHFADEDLPGDDTWDKYVRTCFGEKTFDVEVTGGRMDLEFDSSGFGCSVSAVVIYPAEKEEQGRRFLDGIRSLRRWWFNNDFKRVLHEASGDGFRPSDLDRARGLVIFNRDVMADVYYNDRPVLRNPPAAGKAPPTPVDRLCDKLAVSVMRGQSAPLEFSVLPLKNLGKVTVSAGDLASDKGDVIPSGRLEIGCVSYRITRNNLDGTIYTIAPRLVMPYNSVDCPADITRRFWIRLNTPKDAAPGLYRGTLTVACDAGARVQLPVEVRVLNGTLDEVDIPAGPFGYAINIPWFGEDPEAKAWNERMAARSFRQILDSGFTACSGLPEVTYKGFVDGKPVFDFSVADVQMKLAREAGFKMPFITYCAFRGLDLYHRDLDAMKNAGFTDYPAFIRAIFDAIETHARQNNWLDRYWNLGDEPAGKEAVDAAVANMEAYRKAYPEGPPWFTFCGSCTVSDVNDPHFRMAKAAHVAAWNLHSEESVNALHALGGQWAFYNGGTRWTFGDYMFKCAKQFDMKFRPSWYWNICAGDPYYALDCREDDYAWCNSSPDGDLVPSLHFEQLREGLTDYRALLTLSRLAAERAGTPEGKAARKIIDDRMGSFKLGQRDHDELFGVADYERFRATVFDTIDKLNSRR